LVAFDDVRSAVSHQLKEGDTFGLSFPQFLDEGEEQAFHFFYFGAYLVMRSRIKEFEVLG
jgi:hypothetical protein